MTKFIGNYEDLKTLVSKSGNEHIYICPYCHIITDREKDTEGKFYYNVKKGKGHCFRCETVIVSNGLKDIQLILEELNPDKSEECIYFNQKLNLEGWTIPISEDLECLSYMNNRGISDRTLNRFNVRSARSPKVGVVFINEFINNKYTDFYQIRNIDSYHKHSTLRNLIKPCCWLNYADSNRIVLCEGFTDGLSIFEHCGINPIPLTGKSLSDIQTLQLAKHSSNYNSIEIFVCMDGGFFEDTLKVAYTVHTKIVNSTVRVIPMPWKKDPNELSSLQFNKCLNTSLEYNPKYTQQIRNKVYGRA